MLASIFEYVLFAWVGFWVLIGFAWLWESTYRAIVKARRILRPTPLPAKPDRLRIPRRVDLRDEQKVESWLWQHRT